MAATHEQSFVLDRIALVGNDQLQITGGWHGIDRSYLRLAELLIERADGVTRVEPIAGSMVGGVQRWSARFPIGDPDVIRLQLRVGDALTVDLPWSGHARRRFGRVKLPVQAADAPPAPGAHAPEPVDALDEHPAGEPEAAVGEEPSASGAPTDEDDLVAVHVALLAVRDQLADAGDELATARAEAARAREDAALAREAREKDAVRSREAVASLRAVAEEAVNRERAKLEPLVAERDHLLDERDRATAEHSALRERLEIVEQEHAELAHHRRSVLESAQAQVAALEQDLAAEKDRQSVLAIALSAARSDSQLLAKREGELEATAAELEEASTGWRSAEEEAARLRSELGAARESAQEADAELRRLAAALHDYDEELKSERLRAADAAKAGERAARDAAELERQRDAARNELRRIAEAAQRSEALAARVRDLEQELEQARRALGAANAELEQLKVRLQAVHAALQNGG